jgi:hypothetical protein
MSHEHVDRYCKAREVVDDAQWALALRTARSENERLKEVLAQVVDLCNAMREYAPVLNLEAERTLRTALEKTVRPTERASSV